MCGIVGFSCRTDRYTGSLGKLFVPMLDALATRGPDSAGAAVYSHGLPEREWKYSLKAPGPNWSWSQVADGLHSLTGSPVQL